jgi:broad specificity phosphatase PhoE
MKFTAYLIITITLISLCHSEKKKIIYLVRHGETNFNTDPVPRVRGRIDVPLNDVGIAHCKAAGDFLANEKIGKIYYSGIPRAKQSADCIVERHNGPVEMIEDPLVIDISWGIYEGKTYMEAFGDEKGGDLMFHPEKLIVPQGETFYAVMDRLRLFFVKFWESDEEVCTIVSHGAITNVLSLMFLQAPLEKFWSMYMSACGVSKVQMKSIYSFTIEYWNANYFLKEGEKKYLNK